MRFLHDIYISFNETFFSYFSYHKAKVSFLEYNEVIKSTNDLSIVKINDDNDANKDNNVGN